MNLEKVANLAKIAKVTRMFHCSKKNTLSNIAKWRRLKTHASRFRVDGPKRTFSNTMMSYILYY